jgi:hypothetical protein
MSAINKAARRKFAAPQIVIVSEAAQPRIERSKSGEAHP